MQNDHVIYIIMVYFLFLTTDTFTFLFGVVLVHVRCLIK